MGNTSDLRTDNGVAIKAGAGSDAGNSSTPSNNDVVSVIVPVYNTAPYLAQCLTSIVNQTYPHLEILCFDDGSTDDSPRILDEFAQRDSRIHVIHKANEGYGATCNRGLSAATGTWIAIVEPDDWIESTMFEDMLRFASTFSVAIDVIKTPYWRIVNPDTSQQQKVNCSYRHRIRPASQPFKIVEAGHLLSHHPSIWSALYRRSFLERFEIRFHEIPGAGWADNPFLIDTLCQASSIIYLDNPYYCYREETDAKAKQFALSQPLLPFARWNDMTDRLEELGITDKGIWRAHNSRGFTYCDGVMRETTAPEVIEAARTIFARMDADLVLSEPHLSPKSKRLFCKLREIPCPQLSPLPYCWSLVKQGCYSLFNTSPSLTWALVRDYLRKSKSKSRINE